MNTENKRKHISHYSIKELREICQATAPNPARESMTGHVVRFFSVYLTKVFLYTPIRPNQITFLSVLVFFTGMSQFLYADFHHHIIAVLLVFFSMVLDGCDGEVARAKNIGSVAGTLYVEPISHDVQYAFMFIPVSLGLFWQGFSSIYLILAAVAGLSKLLYRLLEIRFSILGGLLTDQKKINEIVNSYSSKPKMIRIVYWTHKNLFSSTGVFLAMIPAVFWDRMDMYLWFYGVGNTVWCVLLFSKQIYNLNK